MNSEKTELDPLAPRIEEALLLSGKSQTEFGYLHFGDPAFFTKMRKGRQFRTRKMQDKVAAALEVYGA